MYKILTICMGPLPIYAMCSIFGLLPIVQRLSSSFFFQGSNFISLFCFINCAWVLNFWCPCFLCVLFGPPPYHMQDFFLFLNLLGVVQSPTSACPTCIWLSSNQFLNLFFGLVLIQSRSDPWCILALITLVLMFYLHLSSSLGLFHAKMSPLTGSFCHEGFFFLLQIIHF